MAELERNWFVPMEESHEPITFIGGQRGGGKIFFLENALRAVQAENKQLHLKLETITKDRDYYRDAYHHLLRERESDG